MTLEPVLPCCDREPTYKTPLESGRGGSPSTAVVEALAAVDGVDPAETESLYTIVDGEALDRLFANRDGQTRLCLSVDDRNVCVGEGGVACVCDAAGDGAGPF